MGTNGPVYVTILRTLFNGASSSGFAGLGVQGVTGSMSLRSFSVSTLHGYERTMTHPSFSIFTSLDPLQSPLIHLIPSTFPCSSKPVSPQMCQMPCAKCYYRDDLRGAMMVTCRDVTYVLGSPGVVYISGWVIVVVSQ